VPLHFIKEIHFSSFKYRQPPTFTYNTFLEMRMKVKAEADAMKVFQSQTAKNIVKPTVRV
jgi:hypothetical protein